MTFKKRLQITGSKLYLFAQRPSQSVLGEYVTEEVSLVKARAILLCLLMVLLNAAIVAVAPTFPAFAWTSSDSYPDKWKDPAQDSTTDDWRQFNRECTSWVAWALHSRNGFEMPMVKGASGAADWGYKDRSGYGANTTPTVGSVAWWDYGTGVGHVAWVAAVSADKKTITIEDYNGVDSNKNGMYGDDGTYSMRTINAAAPKGYIHFKDLDNANSENETVPVLAPQIIALKRTADPNGVRQVYAATNTAVTEGWWVPGGDGAHVHEIIKIDQHNIVGFDKVNLPGGTQAVYTATSNGIWETWWKPDGSTGQGRIISGLSGVKGVVAFNTTENAQFVHRLYILAGDGPYEAWWKDGGDGIHLSLLASISGGVTFTMSVGPDGTMQLYVAVPTWVYEVWWHPGLNDIHVGTVINIVQGNIRSLSKGDTLSDGMQLLYTGTATTAWQSAWGGGLSGISNGTIATAQVNAGQIKKTVTDGTHQLYLATGDHVQEYWWNDTASGGGELIRIAQNNIGAIDKVNDGGAQELYTGAGNWVYETWWGGGRTPSTNSLFSVAH